ncbi:MAG TPA: hypothetical protein VFX38_06510 [Gammaproteobacteria bacterium]|nr:hypothetical protein [Gammaproteobacteria bacterium]
MHKRSIALLLCGLAATLAAGCTVTLVAPYNAQLAAQASAMQADVSSWDFTMRDRAGTVAADPRNSEVMATLNGWRGEADAMLTLAISDDPQTVHCSAIARATYAAMAGMIPANLRAPESASAAGAASSSGCEAALVADLQSGISDIAAALKWCRVPWVPDAYFAGPADAAPPAAPDADAQTKLTKSCLAEFKAPRTAAGGAPGLGHGRAVSHLLTTLQAIVYVESRKQAAASQ